MVNPNDIVSNRINQPPRTGAGDRRIKQSPGTDRTFDEVFDAKVKEKVQVSRHAEARMQKEGIRIDPGQSDRLEEALDQVKERGGETSLVLLDDMAMVVNVAQRTLITVVSGDRRGEGVFTDIDSAVIAD